MTTNRININDDSLAELLDEVQCYCPVAIQDKIRAAITTTPRSEREEAALGIATRNCTTDECEIDDDARTSENDEGGVWVQAWLYIHPDDIDSDLQPDTAPREPIRDTPFGDS